MFRWIRQLTAPLEGLIHALQAVQEILSEMVSLQRQLGPASDRLESLELSRARWEAEMDARFLKADSKFKAAANAEARERQLKKSYESLAAEINPDRVEPETETLGPVHTVNVDPGEEEGVHVMRVAVAPNDRASAVAHKWRTMR